MTKRGYNAVVDLNDIKNYGSKEPLLIFNGSKSLSNQKSKEFTIEEADRAVETYYSKMAYKNYNLD